MAGATNLSTTPNAEIQSHHSIQIFPPPEPSSAPPQLPPQRPDPNNPSLFFISEEEREKYLDICLPLYEAALKGDWQAAKGLIDKCPGVKNASITKNYDTALHIASSTKHIQFVEELVKLMEPKDLELQNKNWNTALCLAAAAGTVKIAEIMVKKNNGLLRIRGNNNMSPLLMAALFGHEDMVSYLYSKTNNLTDDDWNDYDRRLLLNACVSAKLYDVALKILEHHKKEVALARDLNALHVLARKPLEFDGARQHVIWRVIHRILPGLRIGPVEKKCQALEIVNIIWREVVKLKDDDIWVIIRGPPDIIKVKESHHPSAKLIDKIIGYRSRLLFIAAELGNTKFLIELIRSCPELIWKIDDDGRTIFHIAVLNRQESVYNLLYEIGSIKDLVTSFRDTNDNNILHLAAMKPDQNQLDIVSGVALQMQRELLWFKTMLQLLEHLLSAVPSSQLYLVYKVVRTSSDSPIRFDDRISSFAEHKFRRDGIEVLTVCRVLSVTDKLINMKVKATGEGSFINHGMVVWSTGVGTCPVVMDFMEKIGQTNRRAIATDEWLRVKGCEDVYALGDCATMDQRKIMVPLVCDSFTAIIGYARQYVRELWTPSDDILGPSELGDLIDSLFGCLPSEALIDRGIRFELAESVSSLSAPESNCSQIHKVDTLVSYKNDEWDEQ